MVRSLCLPEGETVRLFAEGKKDLKGGEVMFVQRNRACIDRDPGKVLETAKASMATRSNPLA